MPRKPFSYHIGNVNIDFAPNATSTLHVPASGAGGRDREFRLSGMQASSHYAVLATVDCAEAHAMAQTSSLSSVVMSDSNGVLRFRTHAHCGVSIALQG